MDIIEQVIYQLKANGNKRVFACIVYGEAATYFRNMKKRKRCVRRMYNAGKNKLWH